MGVMIFIAINGDALLIRGFAETFELVAAARDAGARSSCSTARIGAFVGIFVARDPDLPRRCVLALVLTDVAFGLVTKVVPQLNVFSMGLPTKVIVGIVIMAASLPFVARLHHRRSSSARSRPRSARWG